MASRFNWHVRQFLLFTGLGICGFGLTTETAVAQSLLPPEIVKAIEHNGQAFDPITVEWTRERNGRPSETAVCQMIMGSSWANGDLTFLAPARGQFKYQKGKVYTYCRESIAVIDYDDTAKPQDASAQKKRLIKCTGTKEMETDVGFDGGKLYYGHRQESGVDPPVLLIARPDNVPPLKGREDKPIYPLPYLRFAGLRVPSSPRDYAQHFKARSLILDLLERGAYVTQSEPKSEGGARYLTISLVAKDATYLVDLDPSRNYALRRFEERTPAGKLICVADLSDFREVPGKKDFWLPHRCDVQYYQWEGRPATPTPEPFFVETYVITRCESQPIADRDFVVFYNVPGTNVGDATLPNAEKSFNGQIGYVVPADSQDLDKVVQAAIHGTPLSRTVSHAPRSQPHRLAIIIILSNLLVICVIIVLLRRRRRTAPPLR
jgi:hypothetical protein